MAFVKVGALSALPPGSMMEAVVGENSYAICNIGGQLHALDGVCPHAGGPLGQGTLLEGTVMCPWHGYEFDACSGENPDNPMMRVEKIAVKAEGDDILIEAP